MTISTEVFDLIKTLTPSEKRYFVMASNMQSGEKAYLQLFREIDAMTEYDEGMLWDRLQAKQVAITQLHVAKNTLSKQILKALRSFHEKKSTRQQLFATMAEAKLLEGKGLYNQCLKKLRAAEKLAEAYELHRFRAEIIQHKILIGLERRERGHIDYLDKCQIALNDALSKIEKEDELDQIHQRLMAWYWSREKLGVGKFMETVQAMKEKMVLQSIAKSDSFLSKLNYYSIRAFCHYLQGWFALAHPEYKQMLEIWDAYDHIKKDRPRLYKAHIANYLNCSHMIGKYVEFPDYLEMYSKVPDQTFDEEARSFATYHTLQLLYLMNTHEFETACQQVPNIEAGFEKYSGKIAKASEVTIQFNVFYVFFSLELYDEALVWLIKIPQSKKVEPHADAQIFSRIMHLIVHYELGHSQILDDLWNSIYRGLRRIDQLHAFERCVLDHIKTMEKLTGNKNKKAQWATFQAELDNIHEASQGRKIFGLEEVSIWAEARTTGKTFIEAMKNRQAKDGK